MSLQFSLGTFCTGWAEDLEDEIVEEDETTLLVDTAVLVVVVVATEMALPAIMFVVVLDLKTSERLWLTSASTCVTVCKQS